MASSIFSNSPEYWTAAMAAVTAVIAAGTAIWAIYSNNLEWKRTRLLKGIELIDNMYDRFSDTKMRDSRRNAALYLLDDSRDKRFPEPALLEVLNFFEGIAYLQRKEIIELDIIWHNFSEWITPYVYAAKGEIQIKQLSDKTIFQDVTALYNELRGLDRKNLGESGSESMISQSEVNSFLLAESK